MAQFARPDSIVTADLWTGAATAIDESVASDADFIHSPNNPTNTVVIGLSDVSSPDAGTVTLRVRLCRGDADGTTPSSSGTSTSYAIELRQGATVIASVATTAAPTAWTTVTRALTSGERGAITDWSDLRVAVTATGGGGSTSNRRDVAVSWVELETPNFAPVTHDGAASLSGSGTVAASATVSPAPPSDAYGAAVHADTPSAWYRMGEASGGVVDFMGGTSGTANGSLTRDVAGATGASDDGAIEFPGTASDFVSVANHAGIDVGAGPCTYEAWVWADSFGAERAIIDKGTLAPSLVFSDDGHVRFFSRNSALAAISSGTVSAGAWHHIVGTYDGTDWLIYVDGVDVTSVEGSASITDNTDALNIGRQASGDTPFDGKIDEVAIYPTVLSAARVLAHFQAGAVAAVDGQASLAAAATLGANGTAVRQGNAAPTGTGAVTAAATLSQASAAAITGTASASATGTRVAQGSFAPTGLASLSATGGVRMSGSAALSGAGTLAVAGSTVRPGAASLAGTASVGAGATIRHGAATSLPGSGAMGAAAVLTHAAAAALVGSGTVAASGGATAIHDGAAALSSTGSLVASGTAVRQGTSSVAGAASVTAAGALRMAASSSLAAAGSLTASGSILGDSASATLSGTGTLAASPERVIGGTISLDALAATTLAGTLRHGGQVAVAGTAATSIDGTAVRLGLAALAAGATLDATGGLAFQGASVLAGMGMIAAVGQVVPPFVPLHPNAQGRVSVGRDRRDGVALGRTGGRVTVGRRRALVVIVGEEGTVRIT